MTEERGDCGLQSILTRRRSRNIEISGIESHMRCCCLFCSASHPAPLIISSFINGLHKEWNPVNMLYAHTCSDLNTDPSVTPRWLSALPDASHSRNSHTVYLFSAHKWSQSFIPALRTSYKCILHTASVTDDFQLSQALSGKTCRVRSRSRSERRR